MQIPPFCKWTPQEWKEKGEECQEIRDNHLGWDITDYGLGRFDEVGFALITLRNEKMKNDGPISKTICGETAYGERGTNGADAFSLE